jgi:ABC-type antimicrobial peptide transport system permease subunit
VDVTALTAAIRAAGLDTDPGTVLWRVRTMDQLLDEPLAQPRLGTVLMSSFGLVALLLAAIGLYGVMAALVRDQMREIGIRMALGATPANVRRDVLRRAALVTGVGLCVGLAGALATSQLFASLLFDVSPLDPIALGTASVLLLGVGAIAAYVPARRATRVDPVQALRTD